MRLIIGGFAQGKLAYVMEQYGVQDAEVMNGMVKMTEVSCEKIVVNHFHKWVRSCMECGKDPKLLIEAFLEQNPQCIIISDEVGNGIVPMEAFEREYRENVGRLLIMLAGRAESVERVICGIGQKIK